MSGPPCRGARLGRPQPASRPRRKEHTRKQKKFRTRTNQPTTPATSPTPRACSFIPLTLRRARDPKRTSTSRRRATTTHGETHPCPTDPKNQACWRCAGRPLTMGRLRTPGPGAYDTPAHLIIGGKSDTRPSYSFASAQRVTRRWKAAAPLQGRMTLSMLARTWVTRSQCRHGANDRSTRDWRRQGSFNSSLTRSNSTGSMRAAAQQ